MKVQIHPKSPKKQDGEMQTLDGLVRGYLDNELTLEEIFPTLDLEEIPAMPTQKGNRFIN